MNALAYLHLILMNGSLGRIFGGYQENPEIHVAYGFLLVNDNHLANRKIGRKERVIFALMWYCTDFMRSPGVVHFQYLAHSSMIHADASLTITRKTKSLLGFKVHKTRNNFG